MKVHHLSMSANATVLTSSKRPALAERTKHSVKKDEMEGEKEAVGVFVADLELQGSHHDL